MAKYIVLLFCFLFPISSFGQLAVNTPSVHVDEYGAGITIAMSGFGFGGYYRFALSNMFHIGATADFYLMRDDNEVTYFDYRIGVPIQRNNFNRLFLFPVGVELKKRLFSESIEDGFRPYLIAGGGFTFGMNFPRTDSFDFRRLSEAEREELPQNNEYRFTFNFAIGGGVDFTTRDNFYISIRPQVRFIYFPKSIAGKNDHTNFEIRMELGKRLVGD